MALVLLAAKPLATTAQQWKLWYTLPASDWNEALPVGNGRLGAMVFGGVSEENIVLNDITLWSGGNQDADHPEASAFLPEIRQLLTEGRNKEAEKIIRDHFICNGEGSGHGNGAYLPYGSYQVLGTLSMSFDYGNDTGTISRYFRELDLNQAICSVRYRLNGINFNRRVIASFGSDVIAVELSCDVPGGLNFRATLSRPEQFQFESARNEINMSGRLDNGTDGKGMRYFTCLKVSHIGGEVECAGNTMKVRNSDKVILVISSATDYFRGDLFREFAREQADKALEISYGDLLSEHILNYRKYFERVKLVLGDTNCFELPTDKRLAALADGRQDNYLPALYFHYGRYLLICSSRPGLLPANLQGLWTRDIQTPWNGDYHLNINLQMNYWPAEVCQLPEIHQPLLDYIVNLVEPGRKTARAYYDAGGWVAHTISNIWGYTSPGEDPSWGAFMGASGWLCAHLWEHFAFTLDTAYLYHTYPVMKAASEFYSDILMSDPGTGWLITAPSNSPENSFFLPDGEVASVCMGPTMDIQIIRELFTHTILSARILGIDAVLCSDLERKLAKLPPTRIGRNGQVMEWLEDYEESELHHRHVSQLYGLHPANQISPHRTPELAGAARVTLERRGDESTGWSMAWKINLWARLYDGNHAFKLLKDLLRPVSSGSFTFNYTNGGGTYINLLDTHPPFQIDGNLGGCSAISEMLLQSHDGFIHLLPALPDAWPSGHFSGLAARGGFIVNLNWSDKEVQQVGILATRTNSIIFKNPFDGEFEVIRNGNRMRVPVEEGMITIRLEQGDELILNSL